jgi:hypothetical protein
MKNWMQRNRDLIALAFAGLSLLVLEFGLRVSPVTAFAVALVVWLAIWLGLAPRSSRNSAENSAEGSGKEPGKGARRGTKRASGRGDQAQDSEQADATPHPSAADMQTVRATLAALEALRPALRPLGPELNAAVQSVFSDAKSMLSEAEDKPEGFRHDRRALLHYLPQVLALLEQSVEPGASHDPEAKARLVATCQRLAELFAGFRRRKAERQTRALNVQIDVLEAQLRQEGFPPPRDTPTPRL